MTAVSITKKMKFVNELCRSHKKIVTLVSKCLHQKNLQLLLVEMFKTKENWNQSFLKDVFV